MLIIKKSLIGFDKSYEREKNKWIRLENIEFLEKNMFYIYKKLIKKNALTRILGLLLKFQKLLITQDFLIIKVL